jgi:CRISPR system Cascade subunit CasE
VGRAGAIKQPVLAHGPIRDLNMALHDLHRRAGFPSAREIARTVGMGHSTVHNVFARARLPQYDQLMKVAGCLALRAFTQSSISEQALDSVSGSFHELWQRAKIADEVQRGHQATHSTQQITLYLNTCNPRVSRDVKNSGHLHHTVRSLCPANALKEEGRIERLLYRLDRDSGDVILRIQSPFAVSLDALPGGYAHAYAIDRISWPVTGFEGQLVRFVLDASATKAIRREDLRGKRVSLKGAELFTWWERQAHRAGLRTESLYVRALQSVIFRHEARNPTFLRSNRFEGTALVSDPTALQRAVLGGIGRGRSYGLGLLCLSPADTSIQPIEGAGMGAHVWPRTSLLQKHRLLTASIGPQQIISVPSSSPG